MTTYGITSTGFVQKTFDDIQADLQASLRATFGAGINLEPQSVFGQLVGLFADRLSEVWELAEAVYNSQYPDSATGSSLDNLAGLTGTQRAPAKYSTVDVNLTGTANTVVPGGTTFSVTGTTNKFATEADATLDGSGSATGVLCKATETGPIPCPAGTLTVIETPVAGLTSVTNPLDGTLGADLQTDADLRLTREQNLRAEGNAALEAIRDKVLAVTGATACEVFENTTDAVDSDGRPPHSVEVLVQGGADADIRAAIFAAKSGGIATFGSVTGTVTDSEGFTHTLNFNRPTARAVYVVVNLTKDAATWPSDGVAQEQTALTSWGADNLSVGGNLVTSQLYPPVFSVSGVKDVTSIYVGTSPSPGSSANLVAGVRDLFELDSSRITVNVS